MKRKIEWKWTIFKKLFLIIFASFICIDAIGVYLDYLNTKTRIMNNIDSYIDSNSLEKSAKNYNEKYRKLDDKAFLNEVVSIESSKNGYKDELSSVIGEAFVVDKDNNIITNQQYDEQLSFDIYYEKKNEEGIEYEENTEYFTVFFKDYDIDENKVQLLDDIVEKYSKKHMFINVQYSLDSNIKITYLSIEGIILINGKRDQIQDTELLAYYSKNFNYTNFQDDTTSFSALHSIYLSINQSRKLILHDFLINKESEYQSENDFISCNTSSFEKDNHIYYYGYIPLLNSKVNYSQVFNDTDDNVEVDESMIDGYLIFYMCNVDVISRITDDVIYNKRIVYLFSIIITFIVSLIISYIFTKRIKVINHETLRIANNEFDIHLKETPQDELGTLSKSINTMSQQLKQTIDHLNNEIEQVKKLEDVRLEFIANFTHEIKTPLGIINGYIDLIEECHDENKKKEYFEAIEQETSRINELVSAMLSLSKLNSGKVELHREVVNLDELVSNVIDEQIVLIQQKNIQIDIHSHDVMVNVDPFQFQIVMKNFLNNAIKHAQKNIIISYDKEMFSIENYGEHLTDEQMENIWDTYVSSDRQGTGLGLAICKSILDLHGFDYSIENTEKGVCFKIYWR